MAETNFDINELILDQVLSLTTSDLETGKINLRISSIEDGSLQTSADGEEITNNIGSPITTLYRAKRGVLSGTSSLWSSDLYASQLGTQKKIATTENKIEDYTYEVLTISDGTVELQHLPKNLKYIYAFNNGIGKAYTAGAEASANEFAIAEKVITVPTGLTGKVYVEYAYDADRAIEIVNKGSNFPTMVRLSAFVMYRDPCNDGKKYFGKILAKKAKLNAEQVETALTTGGKHPFEFKMLQSYCDDDDELFKVIVAE